MARMMKMIETMANALDIVVILFSLILSGSTSLDLTASGSSIQDPIEYCEAETFTAKCHHDEVILVQHARYGRMRAGRCVVRNYGYLGCSADVLPHLDWMCSGKKECKVRIPDQALDAVNPCPKDLKTYLEVVYQCVKVAEPQCYACAGQSNQSATISGQYGHLASIQVGEDGCGTGLCPWLIQEAQGRRINLTLYDFSLPDSAAAFYGTDSCHRLALIREPDANTDDRVEVCSGGGRETHIYTSQTSVVQVTVDPSFMAKDIAERKRFILKYEAFGCPDLSPPSNAWVRREGDILVVGCTATESTYHLVCSDNKWTGTVGACPQSVSTEEVTDLLTPPNHPMGIMVAIAIGIALIIGSLVLTIGLVYVRRRGLRRLPTAYNISGQNYPACDSRMVFMSKLANGSYCTSECQKACYQAILTSGQSPNPYDYAMEMRPLPEAPDVAPPGESSGLDPVYGRQVAYAARLPGVHCNAAFQRLLPSCEPIYRRAETPVGAPRCCRHYFELDPERVEATTLRDLDRPTAPLVSADGSGKVTPEEKQNKTNRGKEFSRHRSYNGSLLTTFGTRSQKVHESTAAELLAHENNSNKFSWP